MNSLPVALERLLTAESLDDVRKVIVEEPILLSPQADTFLDEKEQELRAQGNHQMATLLYELRPVLAQLRQVTAFKPPDLPGSMIVINALPALLEASASEPIPRVIVTDVFFAVLRSLKQYAKKNDLQGLLERVNKIERHARVIEAGKNKKVRQQDEELLATMQQWLSAGGWWEEEMVLSEHQELLSDDTASVLALLEKASHILEIEGDQESYQQHLAILERARREGIEAAYADLVAQEETEELREQFEDPVLADWLYPAKSPWPFDFRVESSTDRVHELLVDLAAMLGASSDKKRNFHATGAAGLRFIKATLAPADLPLAHDLYQRVAESGGAGSTYVQEGLLDLISAAVDPLSIPFWVSLFDLKRPRDTFSKRRRTLAAAGLARLAIAKESDDAVQALRRLAKHGNPDVRAQAVYYLGQVYLFNDKPLPADIQADLSHSAVNDSSFPCRFHARNILRYNQIPVPLDNPDGVYAFKVTYAWDKGVSRTIQMTSRQTLDALHMAIQNSIKWDADHLYSFYMADDEKDKRYEVVSPDTDNGMLFASQVAIGELGLAKGQTFSYLFDYGDEHLFSIQVVDIRPHADAGVYPRVVAAQGKNPRQYRYAEEEDNEEDE